VNDIINKEITAGISNKKIALVGISQGGALALYAGIKAKSCGF